MEAINTDIIPFKVSARTARLIGRENVASSKGAIIELVKNAYDADSRVCIVYFDNKYSSFLSEFDEDHYEGLIDVGIPKETIDGVYVKNDEGDFILYTEVEEEKKKLLEEKQRTFKNLISKLAALYIIDFGEGMTQNIIRDHWMTIGTDNKANNIVIACHHCNNIKSDTLPTDFFKIINKFKLMGINILCKNNKVNHTFIQSCARIFV